MQERGCYTLVDTEGGHGSHVVWPRQHMKHAHHHPQQHQVPPAVRSHLSHSSGSSDGLVRPKVRAQSHRLEGAMVDIGSGQDMLLYIAGADTSRARAGSAPASETRLSSWRARSSALNQRRARSSVRQLRALAAALLPHHTRTSPPTAPQLPSRIRLGSLPVPSFRFAL
jgi:hypothetical protein